MIGGAKVNDSWYSVFLLGNTVNDIIVLPYVRVDTITWNDPNTEITNVIAERMAGIVPIEQKKNK